MTLGVQEAKRKQKQDGRARIFFRNKVGKLKTPRWGWVWHALWVFKFGLKIYWSGQKWEHSGNFASAQLLSHVQLFVTPWTAAHQASLSFTNSRSLLKLMSIQLVMPSNHLILCLPLLLLPSIPCQNQGLFEWAGQSIGASAFHPGNCLFRGLPADARCVT